VAFVSTTFVKKLGGTATLQKERPSEKITPVIFSLGRSFVPLYQP